MQNWIAWNRTVIVIETVLTLNWTVWNRTVWNRTVWIAWKRVIYLYKNGLGIKYPTKFDMP